MQAWVWFAVAAALAQTIRFALQKQLASGLLSPVGATYARFVWAAPVTVVAMIVYARITGQETPALSAEFWLFAAAGGLGQILATVLVVALFSLRSFAIGITLKKTEVLLTAAAGFLVLGEGVALAGLGAMLVGFIGVLLLSKPPSGPPGPRSVLLGLGSGVCFAVAGVAYRGATLALETPDLILRAGWALAMATTFQLTVMTFWLLWRDPAEIRAVLGAWRRVGLVGLSSLAGSYFWFSAFALQNAAIVFAVGQVELIFSLAVGFLLFGERIGAREMSGVVLIVASAIALSL